MQVDYVVVQAGGKGSRMEQLTENKPKALVPVNNLPMIFHLFRKYPDKKYVIIGDYKYDVLEKYLAEFADVDYNMVCATGSSGTCAGLAGAMEFLPEEKPFMLIWCDLVLPSEYELPEESANYIGISKDFPCRWMYKNGSFAEERSFEQGVAGHFIFEKKSVLKDIPNEGEFVRWLQLKGMQFTEQPLWRTKEYGLISEWKKLPTMRCRPFNSIEFKDGKVYKKAVDDQGEVLAKREVAWYKQLEGYKFQNIPTIYSYEPLCMDAVDGKNIYECADLSLEQKKAILLQIVDCLKKVHELGSTSFDEASFYDAYIGKTFDRLKKVKNLVPFANEKTICMNGKQCRNVFYHRDILEEMVNKYRPNHFVLIHGDCTFSNTMIDKNNRPVLIDPRGYFGKTELFGDAAYDWVKLYYSLVSNYDQFNLKRFAVKINSNNVEVEMASNHWEELEEYFYELLGEEVTKQQMTVLLSITWLSLTTYAWEDYDSICGAFYIGLYYFEEALSYYDE